MKELTENEIKNSHGGFHLNLGAAIFAVVGGFIMGGPVGAGIALGGVIGAQGINNLEEMYHDEFGEKRS